MVPTDLEIFQMGKIIFFSSGGPEIGKKLSLLIFQLLYFQLILKCPPRISTVYLIEKLLF